MKYFLIVNPLSKIYKKGKIEIIKKILETKKTDYEILLSKYPGHTEKLAENICNNFNTEDTTVIAVGGDGTIHEISKKIFNSKIALGIIPAGTANVIAKELSIPEKPENALKIILNRNIKKIFVSKADDHYFLFTCGIGFDGIIVNNVNLSIKKKIGKYAYILSGITSFPEIFSSEKFTVHIDDKSYCADAVIINRAQKYAGNFNLFKSTSLFSKKFEVLIFKNLTIFNFFIFWLKFLTGKVSNSENSFFVTGKKIIIETEKKILSQIDGENMNFTPKKVEITDKFINLIVP